MIDTSVLFHTTGREVLPQYEYVLEYCKALTERCSHVQTCKDSEFEYSALQETRDRVCRPKRTAAALVDGGWFKWSVLCLVLVLALGLLGYSRVRSQDSAAAGGLGVALSGGTSANPENEITKSDA